ncbi:hypothetical protein [Bradyrhizobium symbiodeficiens]|uniref:hypothetical protein n=1 Tax=Bradyrhizobium symbiodeficiens TaxID=1404367 RepID=UPI000BA193E4|nr:hypothetical protein [Bradyrhizobium symbiodeficiens]AWM05767.1 hypothetical protein CIT39_04370 [Bradyrhizobium symbiodeficiens]
MDFQGKDAITHRSDGDWRAAQAGGFACGEACDLLMQDGAKHSGHRQIVLLRLTEALKHAAQYLRDLARRQFEPAQMLERPRKQTLERAVIRRERAASGETLGGVVDVAIKAPEPLL